MAVRQIASCVAKPMQAMAVDRLKSSSTIDPASAQLIGPLRREANADRAPEILGPDGNTPDLLHVQTILVGELCQLIGTDEPVPVVEIVVFLA